MGHVIVIERISEGDQLVVDHVVSWLDIACYFDYVVIVPSRLTSQCPNSELAWCLALIGGWLKKQFFES